MRLRKRASVIIGAGYGDEGKGLATDHAAALAGSDTLVVRFNGGAQAGHTVTTADGRRHVFSHFGSGTLTGCATFLSRFFVCHPLLFERERAELAALGADRPRVLVDPAAMVTTPFDVWINQQLESARGRNRHGSCGIGFGETIEREESSPHRLRVSDLADPAGLVRRLRAIRDLYVPARLKRLGLPPLAAELAGDAVIEVFVNEAHTFLNGVEPAEFDTARDGRPVIFEGAQGLMLDAVHGAFPHVTRSRTGLANVIALAPDTALDVHYITRSYVSRHGAGPLPHELPGRPSPAVVDHTNQPNPWQGSLRFGWLDVDMLSQALLTDLAEAGEQVNSTSVLVTCLDQAPDQMAWFDGGRRHDGRPECLPVALERRFNCRVDRSCGATRADIVLGDTPKKGT